MATHKTTRKAEEARVSRKGIRVKRSHKPTGVTDQERLIQATVEAMLNERMQEIRDEVRAEFKKSMEPAFTDMLLCMDTMTVMLSDLQAIFELYGKRKVSKETAAMAARLATCLDNLDVLRRLGWGFVSSGFITEAELEELNGVGAELTDPEPFDFVEADDVDADIAIDDSDEMDRSWRD
jgi:hypothetical protein